MKAYRENQPKVSRVPDASPKASKQASIDFILQKYRNGNQDVMQFVMRGRRVPGQDGTFIGNPGATHIHIVGNNTHLIVRGARYNFDETTPDRRMRNAYDHLIAEGQGTPGYEECLRAFQNELGIDAKDGTEKKGKDDDDDDNGKDDTKKYDRWIKSGGYMKTDRYGIPINAD